MNCVPADVFLDAVSQKLAVLRELVAEFQRSSPRNTSAEFVRGVSTLLSAVEKFNQNRVQYCETTYGSDAIKKDEQVKFYCKISLRLLNAIHKNYLPLLFSAKQHNEYLILPSINRALQLFEDGIELTLIPDFVFNYMFVGGMENFVENTINWLESNIDAKNSGAVRAVLDGAPTHPRWITFVHFPLSERDSALNLVILAHELAHLVDQVKQLYKTFLPIVLEKNSFKKRLDELCKAPMAAAGPGTGPQLTFESVFSRATLEADFSRDCIAAVQSWLRELIADLIAVHAVGPSYLYAFLELLAHGGAESSPSSSHPSPVYRLTLLLEELDHLGYLSADSQNKDFLRELKSKVEIEIKAVNYVGVMEVAQNTLVTRVAEIQKSVRSFMGKMSFNHSRYRNEVPQVVKMLSAGIAPIQDGEHPCTVPAILNGGWYVYRIERAGFLEIFRAEVAHAKRIGNLNELLFKAIEASEVVRIWKKS
jgi:hypothetical protein